MKTMHSTVLLVLCAVVLPFRMSAQFDCTGNRFLEEIFSSYTSTTNVQYGQNYNYNGNLENLMLDIYEPSGDTASLRPLLIMIHGGNFLGGDKTQGDVAPLCYEFAKKGYVTASINYRVGMENFPFPGPDSVDAAEAVYRATHDARAAVRFFRKDIAENGNTWRIDSSYIFIGGSSAGGLTVLHLAYMDQINEFPSYIDTSKLGHGGGVSGLSGNPGYSSKVMAIINISGALGDTAWMKPGDTPVLSFHGDQDDVVPFGSDMIYLLGQYPLLEVDGSATVHYQADLLGIENVFKPFWGAGHTPHWGNSPDAPYYYDTTSGMMTDFLYHYVCGAPLTIASQRDTASETLSVYPNPARITLHVAGRFADSALLKLYDVTGRLISISHVVGTRSTLDISRFTPGLYVYVVERGNGALIGRGKVLVE